MAVATPTPPQWTRRSGNSLEDNGFEVLSIRGLGYTEPFVCPPPPSTRCTACPRGLCPEADVLFVSCTGLGVADGIPMLERDFGVPVVTSNQASLWCAPARTLHPGRRGPGRAVPALMRQTCVSAAARQWGRRSARLWRKICIEGE